MTFLNNHKHLLSFIFALVVFIIVNINIYNFQNEGIIKVVFYPVWNQYRVVKPCVMTIKPDGTVITEIGDKFKWFHLNAYYIPRLKKVTQRAETKINNEEYEFFKKVIYKEDYPNLKNDVVNRDNCWGCPVEFIIATTNRRYRFAISKDPIDQENIINQFVNKLYEVCPFELFGQHEGL